MGDCILQRLMGTAQDNDEDFKWRPPTGDGVLGKKDEYQADDNEVFRVEDEVPLASAAYSAAAGPHMTHYFATSGWLICCGGCALPIEACSRYQGTPVSCIGWRFSPSCAAQ